MTSLLAPAITTMSLADLPAATSAYIHDQVEVKVGAVTANLQPFEDGTYTVRWTNAEAPDGVRLRDVMLHITVSPGSVAKLKVPGSAILQPRTVNDFNSPRPPTDSLVPELYVFLPAEGFNIDFDSGLDVGETAELELEYEALGGGTATFSAHIHATVVVEDLFPRGPGSADTKAVKVKP